MALTLVVLASVVAYMADANLGFVVTLLAVLATFGRPGRSALEKLLTALVLTAPLYMVPILPGLHHVLSWTSILLVIFTIVAASRVRRLGVFVGIALIPLIALTIIAALGASGSSGDAPAYYIAQFLLFTVPAITAFQARAWLTERIGQDGRERLVRSLAAVLLAMGLGVVVQKLAHDQGIVIGSVSYFSARTSFDLTISAYSVLSCILAVGLVLVPVLLRRGWWVMGCALGIVSALAIIINTSRSGMIVGSIVLIWSLAFPPRGIRRVLPRLLVLPIAGFGVWWMLDSFESGARAASLSGVLDDNGRGETLVAALQFAVSHPSTFLLGIGYDPASYPGVAPHNFFVETLLRSGAIVTAIVLCLVFGMLLHLRRSELQYPVWVLLGGSMLFSGFYAVKFAVVVAIVVVACQTPTPLADGASLQERLVPSVRRR